MRGRNFIEQEAHAPLGAGWFTSCNADISGGLYRTVNVYSLDGKLLATYEGKIDIDDNTNGSVMFDLDGKRYVYYHAIVEVIEK